MYPNKYLTELIKDALDEEAKSSAFYETLAGRLNDIDDKNRLKQMSLDEKKHYNMLNEMYEKLTGKPFAAGENTDEDKDENIVKCTD